MSLQNEEQACTHSVHHALLFSSFNITSVFLGSILECASQQTVVVQSDNATCLVVAQQSRVKRQGDVACHVAALCCHGLWFIYCCKCYWHSVCTMVHL